MLNNRPKHLTEDEAPGLGLGGWPIGNESNLATNTAPSLLACFDVRPHHPAPLPPTLHMSRRLPGECEEAVHVSNMDSVRTMGG